jgi:4'-phosphopantetheinyl transferase
VDVTAPACDVHWASLDQFRPSHLDLLDATEHARRTAYVREDDRTRFALAAALLRLTIAARTGTAPEAVEVDRTCPTCGKPHGRPRLPGGGLHLSVTHSGACAAVAVTQAGPVGVDVEALRAFDHERLLEEVLAPQEHAAVTGTEAFLKIWTRKEAVLKATGAGLTIPMHELAVTGPQHAPELLRYPGDAPVVATMTEMTGIDGCVGTVTVLTGRDVTFEILNASFLPGFGV